MKHFALTVSLLIFALVGNVRATPLVLQYDLGHVPFVRYTLSDPVSLLPVTWEVSINPLDPTFVSTPSQNFLDILAAAFPTWTFRTNTFFPPPNGADLALSDDSLIVREYSAIHEPGLVGADIFVEYSPHGLDPAGAAVHWIQVVTSNHRLGAAHGTPENVLDNNGGALPYYDVAFPDDGDSTGFTDSPRREDNQEHQWSAELFLVLEVSDNNGLGGREVQIYDGLEWGWENVELGDVPEPSTLSLIGVGTLLTLLRYARGRTHRDPTRMSMVARRCGKL